MRIDFEGNFDSDIQIIKQEVHRIIGNLADRERIILMHRFFDKMTLKEISDKYGISSARVRQLQIRAMEKFKHPKKLSKID